ncbi:MAG: HesA/MoeB/ThiF family protein [Crenarchaeota archaeon]|nr:HesA/MoeB/ThiF family protein [Thermoproteota archaeon]MCR8455416.1 HesA/MoeB/ThiF family protein [Thermoproteota archaeon]
MISFDKERYSRQLPIVGEEGQKRLESARVLIAGVGGLGSIVSIYLAASGIGKLILVDPDIIKLSDLNRQILYTSKDLGKKKVAVAKERLQSLNPEVNIDTLDEHIAEDNAFDLVKSADIIVDCLDNWKTRFILDEAICKSKKILIHGGIEGLYGQVTDIVPHETLCLRRLISEPRDKEFVPVLGTTPGIIGLIQATETIKLLAGIGRPLINKMLVYDGYITEFNIIELKPTQENLYFCWGECHE